MKKLSFVLIGLTLCCSCVIGISSAKASIITSSASEFFSDLVNQGNTTQSVTNKWQIGMYSGNGFELFDYSPTTVLGTSSIVGWVKNGFHAAFLNISDNDEVFPGNVFEAGALVLHPGQNGAEIVLRYLVQQEDEYDVLGNFFALDTIECIACTSDGVNVSIRVNGNQLDDSLDIIGFDNPNTHSVTGNNLLLQQEDVIDFLVMPRSTFFDDATKVTATVSREAVMQASGPSSTLMLILGLSILLLQRKAK